VDAAKPKVGLAQRLPWIAPYERILPGFRRKSVDPVTPEQPVSLPSFFVIGPPRTGSTWLYEALNHHTLLPKLTKETRFFDTHFHRGFNWYRAHYPRANNGRIIGEVAPTYFASAEARERIARAVPQARVVCVFRDPVERILSLYRLKCAYGLIRWNFEQAILNDPELLESGRYATNLKAWRQTLGANPRNYYRTRGAVAAADWCKARRLDLAVTAVKNSPLMKFFLGGGRSFAELSCEASLRLYEHFLPEVEELEALLNRDFSLWKPLAVQAV